jgi:tRNA threonylcarbamoyladenosine biosynthesis protein TsaB
MLLLSVDTSGRDGSIALARASDRSASAHFAEGNDIEVIEVVRLSGGAFSAQLVPQIAALLAAHGFNRSEIGAFVVASGPGSFTGLRVGLAAIKALSEVLGKPIVAVSLLEAIAFASAAHGKVIAILDAGRGDVYAGEYEIAGTATKFLSERLLSREEFGAETLASNAATSIVTSDKVLAEFAQSAGLPVFVIEPVDTGVIAQLGFKKIQAGETTSPEQLEANYIRRTDAEIFAKG